MIATHDLAKHFKDSKRGLVKAVDGVTVTAKPGSVFGLLGVNGAGKTTMLRMLSTVLQPTSGSATILGYDIVKNPKDVRASIGFMSNSTALYGRLTAREVIRYFGGLHGMGERAMDDRMEYVVETFGIAPYLDSLCDKLSTGQKQRVNIARTIFHDPPALFFDEPTAGLDVVAGQSVLEFIEECRDNGKTVMFSTHIMSEVERLCDVVSVIHDGVIKGEGTVDELKHQTQTATLEKAFLSLVEAQA